MCPDKNNQPTTNQPPTNRQPTATEKKSIRRSKKVEEDTVRARGPTYSDAFESFWGVVAPHKRKSKAEAFRRYREATSTLKPREADPATFLLDRATAYYSSALGQTPYCNGPAPWLNKGGYDDDPAAWERKGDTHSKQGAGQVHPSDNLDEEGTF